LKHKVKLRKLRQEIRDPICKTAVKWVTQNIRRMVRIRAPERWGKNLVNCEITPQAIWPIAKSLRKRGGPKAPSAIHGPLSPLFYPIKANAIGDCLENQLTAHSLCDCDHRQQVEAAVQAPLAAIDEDTPVKFRLCDVRKKYST
jgi:hypothetical protein